MVHLQFVKPVVNCGLAFPKASLRLLVVSFEDGSMVRFLPSIVGSQCRSSLSQMRSKRNASSLLHQAGWRGAWVPFRLPATLVSFRKEPSPEGAAEGCEK
jgi:hypothetical protein